MIEEMDAKSVRESVSDSTVMMKRLRFRRAFLEASLPVQPKSSESIVCRLTFLTVFARAVIACTGDILMMRMPVP